MITLKLRPSKVLQELYQFLKCSRKAMWITPQYKVAECLLMRKQAGAGYLNKGTCPLEKAI